MCPSAMPCLMAWLLQKDRSTIVVEVIVDLRLLNLKGTLGALTL